MYLFDVFRSFLPAHNPIGFGAADFIVFILAALLLFFTLVWPRLEPFAARFARKPAWCMIALALLPVVLRLAMLAHHPAPRPEVYDEFSHLLAADTLRHFRLANPAHPMSRFFETFFVLQQPAYGSIYPIGQGLSLAIGRAIFGFPWAGVLLSTAAFCALCYWMLGGWVSPGWALAGGALAAMEFGPLSMWMNSYWGGAFAAAGGCLIFGALPRLRNAALELPRPPAASSASSRRPARGPAADQGARPTVLARYALLLGAGFAINILTRPFESVFLLIGAAAFFIPDLRNPKTLRPLARAVAIAALAAAPALVLTLLQNKQATGSWTTLPYQLSQYQYGVPAAMTFQANVEPHRDLTPQQAMDYKMQRGFHSEERDTLGSYFERLQLRVREYRFYFLPPLYIALLAFPFAWRQWRFAWVAATLALLALGINFFPAFRYHYLAGVACLFVLASVVGLERISQLRIGGGAACRILVFLCAAQFLFWYAMHAFEDASFSEPMRRYETWDQINHDQPTYRSLVNDALAQMPGRLLVFVRYYPQHIFQNEWVWNEADIDAARVVRARDLGPAGNEELLRYYPNRTALLLEPDFRPPRLGPYGEASTAPPAVTPRLAAPEPAANTKTPSLFEDVPRLPAGK